jgi:hypothetical protein
MPGDMPAEQVGMVGPYWVNQLGEPHTVDFVFRTAATQGDLPQVISTACLSQCLGCV